ncbi:MAG TPA: BatD family protein, partial [Bacteroidaceae bacterium]|nr:BatD family protein [Bacteroidaceae bacterium]
MKDLSIMKQTKRWFSLAGILCMLICAIPMQSLRADEQPTIQASAQPNPAVVGERIRVTFELNTQNAKNIQVPNMDIDGLTVLFGPSESRSSNISFINGKMNRESRLTITYMLRADKAGNFQLGVASAVHKSSKLRSNALTIKVLPQDQAGGIDPQGKSNTSSVNKKETSGSKQTSSGNKSNDLFIRAIV